MNKAPEADTWWKVIPALPASARDHDYYALRRVWGDHTITGARSFYRTGSEDNITPALFQTWSIFSDPMTFAPLIRAAGGNVGRISRVRWAYACEELIGADTKKFVIPDIMLAFEDDDGPGVVAFEVKKPGVVVTAKDAEKLQRYLSLPSMERYERTYGCFLIGEFSIAKSRSNFDRDWPILTWGDLAELQSLAVDTEPVTADLRSLVKQWIARAYARCGTLPIDFDPPPAQASFEYGTEESYRAIDAQSTSDRMKRFLKGSECVEQAFRGKEPNPPLPWLSAEPSVHDVRSRKQQSTPDRRVCRWSFNWTPSLERNWR